MIADNQGNPILIAGMRFVGADIAASAAIDFIDEVPF